MKKKSVSQAKSSSRPQIANSVARSSRQTREKASRFAVLGMLSLGCKSGYDIKKTIAVSTSNFWSESYGNIYPVLKQLLAEGAIREEKEAMATGGRKRLLYGVTASGRHMLQEWLRQPVTPRVEDSEFLLKLFFGAQSSVKDMLGLVKAHREHHEESLAKFAEIERYIVAQEASEMEKMYWLATLRHGEAVSHALVEWSKGVEKELKRHR